MVVLVDISDIYYKLLKKFGNGKLNYVEYLKACGEQSTAIAYGCQEGNEANSFIRYLRSLGFFTKYKRPYTLRIGDREIKRCNWLVAMAVDAIKSNDRHIILGTSNPDIIPLVKYLTEADIKVTILACNIPKSLQKLAECIEITEDMLENENISESS